MVAHGVPVWGLTVQNEPEFAAPWEACLYTPEEEARFVAEYLGPALKAAHPGVKLLAHDHNKDHVEAWAQATLNSSSRAFVDGLAVHWYEGDHFDAVARVHARFPDALLLPTEA